jgi:uncharacterized protein YndB with AHSA1/START domain
VSITSVEKDFDNRTLILIADFNAPLERVWTLWEDPRQLEKWWGPPGFPSTFEEHNLIPGGQVTYYMTGPEGETHRGWWRIDAVTPPTSLRFTDGFADQQGNPIEDMPVSSVHMQLSEHAGGTRMELRSVFASREQMQQTLDMGAAEGMQESIGQMDALLAA